MKLVRFLVLAISLGIFSLVSVQQAFADCVGRYQDFSNYGGEFSALCQSDPQRTMFCPAASNSVVQATPNNYSCCSDQASCSQLVQQATPQPTQPAQSEFCTVGASEIHTNSSKVFITTSRLPPGNIHDFEIRDSWGRQAKRADNYQGPGQPQVPFDNVYQDVPQVYFYVVDTRNAQQMCRSRDYTIKPALTPFPTSSPGVAPSSAPGAPQAPGTPYNPQANSLFLFFVNPLTVTGNSNPLLGLIQGFVSVESTFSTPAGFLNALMPFLFSLAGMILFIMIVWGGFEMVYGAGDTKSQEAGKQRITAALIGFTLLFVSYWIAQILQAIFGVNILGV